jgi:hypothetical protein
VGVSTENITTESTEGTENNVLEYYHLGEKLMVPCATSLAGAANTLLYSLIEDKIKNYSNALADLKRSLCENLKLKKKIYQIVTTA